jgi:peptidoglycan hydrolase CwlO-like protein
MKNDSGELKVTKVDYASQLATANAHLKEVESHLETLATEISGGMFIRAALANKGSTTTTQITNAGMYRASKGYATDRLFYRIGNYYYDS